MHNISWNDSDSPGERLVYTTKEKANVVGVPKHKPLQVTRHSVSDSAAFVASVIPMAYTIYK